MEQICKAVEHTDLLQGFIATHSCSGDTGGGLSAYIFQCLLTDYDKFSIVHLPIYPSPQQPNTVVEPYNTVLHLDQAVDAVKLSKMMDNETIGIDELVHNVFGASGRTVKCDLNRGKLMACVLSFRGPMAPRLVNRALSRIKATPHMEFADWCPTGVKANLVTQPPILMVHYSHLAPTDCSATMLANTTAIRSVWATVGVKFDMMFSRRCFLHWFLKDGLEESEMKEARETLASIEQDYREIGMSGDRNLNFFTSTYRTLQVKRRQ
ncbi:hypothetical protein P879_08985 [Paragonimus westermani]|uniref:Tubulin/FtsZ 2-layer sandwich domain-containing protein n=1 Tax=Paragonimus westermani TaxID=34504 RepID=A0A8T0DCB1_9TREM|nr:hypothetical protein P879_08985 [Paragonimus westermani]